MYAFAAIDRLRPPLRVALFALAAAIAVPCHAQSPAPDILAFRFTLAGAAVAGPEAAAGRVWIVSGDRTLYILDDSGRAVGRRPWRDGNPAWIAPDRFGRALLPAADGALVMVNRAGLEVYRVRPGGRVARAPVFGSDGRFFAAAGSRLLAYSAGGRLLWSADAGDEIVLGPLARFNSSGETRIAAALANGRVLEYGESGSLLSELRMPEPPSAWAALGDGLLLIGPDGYASARGGGGEELFRLGLGASALAAAGDGPDAWILQADGRVLRVRADGSADATVSSGIQDARDIRVFPERILVLGPRGAASLGKDGQVYRDLALRHAPRMPAVTPSGLVLSAGEDWILYAYRFESPLGDPAVPEVGYVDFQAARRRAEEESFWNPGFVDDGALRELRRIENSLRSATIGAGEPDALVFCSALALGYGSRESNPRGAAVSPGVLPRSLACDILGTLGSPRAVPVLVEAFLRDQDPAVRASAARALGAIGLDPAGEALRAFQWAAEREFFLDENGALAAIDAVEGIYRALGELSDPGGIRAIMRLAGKPYGSVVRTRAQAALRRLSEPAR